MEEEQQRTASRRFWEEGPAIAVAPLSLSPPVQQQQLQQQLRDRSSSTDRVGVTAVRAPAAISRVKISAASGVDGADVDGEAKQGSSELKKLAFTVADGI